MSDSKSNESILLKFVPLIKWKKHFSYPSYGTMRNIVDKREENGASEFLSMINKRFYVNVEKFHIWIEKQPILRRKRKKTNKKK